jgi:ribose transport system permease protein
MRSIKNSVLNKASILPFVNKSIVFILLFLCILVFGIISPSIIAPRHLLNISVIAASLGVVAMGQTIVMLTGCFDLSVGAVMTLVNVLGAGIFAGKDLPSFLVIPFLIIIGLVIGFINGYGVSKLKIPPFMMTLGMWLVIRGLVLVYTGGGPRGYWPKAVQFFAKGRIGGVIPIATLFWLAITVLGIYLLKKTKFGRYFYAIGGNSKAAFLSGVKVHKTLISAFVICSLLSTIAGILLSGYVGWGSFQVGGELYLMHSIAAAVLGGTTFTGGIGGLAGTFCGAYLLTLIDSLLTMVGIGHPGRLVFTGAVLIAFTGFYEKISKWTK